MSAWYPASPSVEVIDAVGRAASIDRVVVLVVAVMIGGVREVAILGLALGDPRIGLTVAIVILPIRSNNE